MQGTLKTAGFKNQQTILIDHGFSLRRVWEARHHRGVQVRRYSRAHACLFQLHQVLDIRGCRVHYEIQHLAENDDHDSARLPQQLPVPDIRGCRVHSEIHRAKIDDRDCADLPQLLPEPTNGRYSDHQEILRRPGLKDLLT